MNLDEMKECLLEDIVQVCSVSISCCNPIRPVPTRGGPLLSIHSAYLMLILWKDSARPGGFKLAGASMDRKYHDSMVSREAVRSFLESQAAGQLPHLERFGAGI